MTNSGGPHCYGDDDDLNLQPNPANDGSNPAKEFEPPPPPANTPTGNEVTQGELDEKGRCYDEDDELPLPPSRGDLAPDDFDEPEPEPELTPNEVIKEIIGRCYPDVAPVTLPEVRPIDPPPSFKIDLDPGWSWMCDFFPDLANGLVCKQGPTIKLQVPDPGKPGWPHYDVNGDCERIRVGLLDGTVVATTRANEFKDLETGEILICDEGTGEPNEEWEICVEQTLECLFRPYATGTWKPPRGDCESYVPRGWNADLEFICIKNCFPDRIPVYESTLTSGSEVGIPVLRVFMGPGNHNKSVMTSKSDGSWNGRWQKMENGAQYFQSNGQTISHSFNGFTIEGRGDTSDGDMDSEWRVVSTPNTSSLTVGQVFTSTISNTPKYGKNLDVEIEITSGGQGINHAYHLEPNAPAGYTLTNAKPAFYILKNHERNSVPLYSFYSSSTIDTFLTTNPGAPDSPGDGERSTMDSAGMGQGQILGYVFQDKNKSIPYIGEDEEIAALHRYYNAYGNLVDKDHRYDINDQFGPPQIIKKYQIYPLPYNPKTSLFIFYDIHKGAAGYENCWGYYLAQAPSQGVNNAPPEPSYGKIIKADGTNSAGLGVMRIPLDKLKEYAGGYLGFFIVPDGNDQNSVSDGDTVSFSETSNNGGWRTNLDSAEQDLAMFSDARLNWKDKDFTRLQGRYQWWEDLLDGDEDYDDFKVLYNLAWNGSGYLYEGIQCYVYRDPNPPKVLLPNVQRTPCDPRKFAGTFKDVTVIRTKCGSMEMPDKDGGMEYECGKCTGKYQTKINKRQTLQVIANGNFKIMAFGSITSSTMGECMRFTLRLERKPQGGSWTQIWEEKFHMKRWPHVGHIFQDNLQVYRKDKLRLTVVDIHKANFQSMNQVKLALYDNDEQYFDHNFTINLGSMSQTDNYTPATSVNTDEGVVGGSAIGFNMDALYDRKGNRKNEELVWSYFSGRRSNGGNGSGVGNSDSDDYVMCPVWRNSARNEVPETSTIGPDEDGTGNDGWSMDSWFYGDNSSQPNDNRYGGIIIEEPDSIDRRIPYNEDNRGLGNKGVKKVFGYGGFLVSFGDTGPQYRSGVPSNVRRILKFPSFPVSRIEQKAMPERNPDDDDPEFRYHLTHDRGLFGWWADQPDTLASESSGEVTSGNQAGSYGDHDLYEVWETIREAGYIEGADSSPQVYTNFHPDAWFHDYYLRDESCPLGDAKVRVMFMPVSLNIKSTEDDQYGASRNTRKYERQIVWCEIVEILDAGTGYSAGQTFELTYPPVRDKEEENPANSPFYPDQESGFKMPKEWRYHSRVQGNLDEESPIYDNGRSDRRNYRTQIPQRTPLEAIYQESHNKDSKVWYWCSDKFADRIRFRIRIASTDPESTTAETKYEVSADIAAWSNTFVNNSHREGY